MLALTFCNERFDAVTAQGLQVLPLPPNLKLDIALSNHPAAVTTCLTRHGRWRLNVIISQLICGSSCVTTCTCTSAGWPNRVAETMKAAALIELQLTGEGEGY